MWNVDHLVHYIETTPASAAEHMRQLGFHTAGGGSHTNWGTWNSLCYMDLTYIEWIGIEHGPVAEQSENALIRQLVQDREYGEGLCQIALRTSSAEETASLLQQRGLSIQSIAPGMRRRPDGSMIQWSMLFVDSAETEVPLPFFIDWKQADTERQEDLMRRGLLAPHPNGVTGIESVVYAVRSLEIADLWAHWFDAEATEAFQSDDLQGVCRAVSFANLNILFCKPSGDGLAQQALETRGERPFLVRYQGKNIPGQAQIYGSTYIW
ncbi:VOC family protein [Ectobacillus ponti]|uniref:VOC family protein n=1 Tax=Ectobacillus ponti TaxID=2961894 RepID=A0AA41XCG4_9BACI|nr:VOC family protein [Ectobacillus ponti]MCP8970789.1 VOC family protein [Ectobacillus ponti]